MSWAIWITGRPGSGKTTIARALAADRASRGEPVVVLELDALRKMLTPVPTYGDAEREAVYRALVYLAKLVTESHVPVVIDATGHRRAWRALARFVIPFFAEVQLCCPVTVCRTRERTRPAGNAPAGIYARAGQPGSTVPGVDVPYEPALAPDAVLRTAAIDPAAAVRRLALLTHALATAAPAEPARTSAGWVVWITGPPGSGKTTLAANVAKALATRDVAAIIVDVASIRRFLAPAGPGHEEIIHRALVCAAVLLSSIGVPVIVDAAAPRRRWRQLARDRVGHYAEVELACPADVCAERARAARWTRSPSDSSYDAIQTDMTDSVGWEPSVNAELTLHTDGRDVTCMTEEIVGLAWRLHRAAQSERIAPDMVSV